MKKNGFTLIELLAVIVVLAIISLIAVPIVLNIIEKARIGVFRNSIYGLEKAAELYTVNSNYNAEEKLEFICNSNTCETVDGKTLNFKGEVPIGGSIIIEDNIITINYIKNSSYCALGTIENLDIKKDCTKLDITEAELILEPSKASSNSILVRVRANDKESGIKSIEYIINDKSKEIEDKKLIEMVDKIYLFDNLDKNTEYQIKVKVTNGNDKVSEQTINIKTEEIENPNITYANTPTDSIDGYLEKQVINVTFNNSNITTPSYYIKTTRKGTSNLNVNSSCGTGLEPETCSNITSTNILNVNTWYKVTGNVNVTYSDPSDITDTLYAITYDGRNYSGASTGTINKIIQPVTGISLNRTSATLENDSTLQLIATVIPSNATNKMITWTSSNIDVATVDSNGLVTAKGKLGTTTITATSNSGKMVSATITVNKTYLANMVNVGDYIAYDAGTWTSSASTPTIHGEFGGYTAGQNKAISTSACWPFYTPNLNGWRVLKIENNQVYLVHAGQPECYYHKVGGDATVSIANLNNRTTSQYLNADYASSAHNINKDELESIAQSNNLRMTGLWYWSASHCSDNFMCNITNDGNIYYYNDEFDDAFGIRPVIVLKEGIKTTGKTTDAIGQEAWSLVAP